MVNLFNLKSLIPVVCNEKRTATKIKYKIKCSNDIGDKSKYRNEVVLPGSQIQILFVAVPFSLNDML